jgi:hypothetical protein
MRASTVRQISTALKIKAPSSFALAFMNTYFLERGPQSGSAVLALRFPLPRFVVEGLTIEKRVTVQLHYKPGGPDGHHLTLSWQPIGSGPIPSFDGSVTANADSETTSTLTISGAYAPPGGVVGAVFDELIGVRIARATLAALLDQLREAIESDYRVRLVP